MTVPASTFEDAIHKGSGKATAKKKIIADSRERAKRAKHQAFAGRDWYPINVSEDGQWIDYRCKELPAYLMSISEGFKHEWFVQLHVNNVPGDRLTCEGKTRRQALAKLRYLLERYARVLG